MVAILSPVHVGALVGTLVASDIILINATAATSTKTLTNPDGTKLTVEIPTGFVSFSDDVRFQMSSLNEEDFGPTSSPPTGVVATGKVYNVNLSRVLNGIAITTLAKSFTLNFFYSDSDISEVDESTLQPYRWNGSQWIKILGATLFSGENRVLASVSDPNYFVLMGEQVVPAQVIINSITDNTVPSITANVTISNEGTIDFNYNYEWCVVPGSSNTLNCSDFITGAYASAFKLIKSGEDFTTNLNLTVPDTGNYFFRTLVYWGTEVDTASRSFVAVQEPSAGGRVGGGGAAAVVIIPTITAVSCNGADFNADKKVNSIDFSILLAFWQKLPPFKNPCVDINKDGKVNSIDFSILLYEWGKK